MMCRLFASQMEKSGVQIVYGFANLKTHSKASLIIRKEFGKLRSYAHVGTGNYHPINAKIYEDLSNALKDATLIFGTSARSRTIPWPTKTSSELSTVLKKALESSNAKVCFVFGREISGLSNEELQMCDYHIKIPTDEDFSSINLSHAVQIISYVLKMEINNIDFLPEIENESQTFQENEYLIDHFDEVMKKMDFYDQENPKQVKTRMRRLIKRLQPDKLETGILRGFLAKIEQMLNKKN